MCLILFSFQPLSDLPLVVAANRDEFFQRKSASAHFWEDSPNVLAGRDLVAGGTWLGITRSGKFAAVTNVREPDITVDNALSRGQLTRNFLSGDMSAMHYLNSLESEKMRYSGFNLLIGEITQDKKDLFYYSNRCDKITRLTPGTYGLSNHLLNTDWPKVAAGKHFLNTNLNRELPLNPHQQLREFLEDATLAEDKNLPETGVSYEWEKALSAAFIRLPEYGTRTSTVVTFTDQDIVFSEKQYIDDNGKPFSGNDQTYQTFTLEANPTAKSPGDL